MSKQFYYLLLSLTLTSLLNTRACDLCGCYTPQIEAMPQSADESTFGQPSPVSSRGSWLDRAYFAVAEQFTHFGTVQIDGHEGPNPTDNTKIARSHS